MLEGIAVGAVLLSYTLLYIKSLGIVYRFMVERGFSESLAVYVNRKLVHIFAAGLATLTIPLIPVQPDVIAAIGLAMATGLYLVKKRGFLMDWFQTRNDDNEISFIAAWSLSILTLWIATRNKMLTILPALYISFGDGVTGIVRALVAGRRVKHPVGNLAMLAVTAPIGFVIAGPVGLAAATAASIVERFDKPLDDNMLIALVSTTTILASKALGVF